MKTLLILLASAALACAELSPEDFNRLRNAVIKYDCAHFVGISRIGNRWLYRFDDAQNQPVAFIPMEVVTFEQAFTAFYASLGTMILCERQWKTQLESYINRESRLPPPGFTEELGGWSE